MLWQQPQFTCSMALLCSRLFLTVLSRLFVHFFLPHFSLPVNFPWILFDTDLCTQTAFLALSFHGLLSWRMLMIWKTIKSAVVPMIAAKCAELNQKIHVYMFWTIFYLSLKLHILIIWDAGLLNLIKYETQLSKWKQKWPEMWWIWNIRKFTWFNYITFFEACAKAMLA